MKFQRVIFTPAQETESRKAAWQRSGDVGHMLSSKRGLTFSQLCEEFRKDTTNYRFGPPQGSTDDRSSLPMPGSIATALIDLIEHGYVKVVK